ncbi:N-acetyltransferase [Geodermatophilus sp. TF02-6]|uniref:GNAT family N-acetyltransferase n=1 Tax=Geodermatophilus sp. TF02-6 TaxID=2250575 RepID=UPI000DEA99EC|nr:GNAT family N-acetyltransferase [Geodermatophilus sp. TF02-6]RBY76811.1 N-acetyltransferase [Geodermatophilus sp. TF02-6]
MGSGSEEAESRRVVDNPERQRYEVLVDGELAGSAAYQRAGQLVVFTSTEVEVRFEGQGLGGELVRRALDGIRRSGTPVLPLCPFVQQWMSRHPDYHDLDYRRPESHVSD